MKKIKANDYLYSKWINLFLLIICFIVYYPILRNSFLTGWDDQWMVFSHYTENGWTIDNLWHIFTDFFGGQYAPFASLSYLFLYTLFGYDPLYFHLYSLLWHIGCVFLVWKFISSILRMHGEMEDKHILFITLITTILFAVHPINVETVAWISALKILLYAFFYLLGLLCYLRYIEGQKITYYLLTIVCFLCSFLGKEQAVTFPLTLLVIDWFANRDLKNIVIWSEKMSFFIMAFLFGAITILSQGKSIYEITFPLHQRLIFGCFALIEYITKCLFPVKLNFFYPFPIVLGEEVPLQFYIYPVLILLLIGWGWVYRRNKYIIFGVLLFIVNLLLSIHIINMSRHSIIADRYMYLSYIGIAFLIGYGILYIKLQFSYLKSSLFVLSIYIFLLSVYTFQYAKKWENTSRVKEYTKEILDRRVNQGKNL
ncbi:hypothetical protein [Parabacteroides faecis]|uniref:hypothetical protein n=1 Tax=Parabacteroides faecis TaxID=1217282 RepID=UPI00351FAEC2